MKFFDFFSVTSSELAAWVQAAGTIAAVFLAPWLADQQHKKTLEQEQVRREAEAIRQLTTLITVLEVAIGCAEEVMEATQSNQSAVVFAGTSLAKMIDVKDDLKRIDLFAFPNTRLTDALIEARAIFPAVIAAAEWATSVGGEPPQEQDQWTAEQEKVREPLEALQEARIAAVGLRASLKEFKTT